MSHRSLIHVLSSPVRFFRARAAEGPSWLGAITPVILHGLLAAVLAAVSVSKGQTALAPALGVSSGGGPAVIGMVVGALFALAFAWLLFALHAGIVVILDVVFSQSGRARRLVEFTGYAYLPSVLWAGVSLVVLAVWWNPEPLRVGSTLPMSDLPRAVADFQVRLAQTPVQIALRTVGLFIGLWLVALQAAALSVVSGFSARGATAAGVLIGALLVVLPWVFAS